MEVAFWKSFTKLISGVLQEIPLMSDCTGDPPHAEGQNGSETYAPNHITLRLRDATAPILLPTSCYFHGGFCNVLIIKMLQGGVWK